MIQSNNDDDLSFLFLVEEGVGASTIPSQMTNEVLLKVCYRGG